MAIIPGDRGHVAEHNSIDGRLDALEALPPGTSDPAVAGFIGDPESDTAAALSATFVAAAGRRPLVGFQAALGQRDTTPVDIVVLGDSIAEGQGATTVANRWVSLMLAYLRARLGVTGGGVGYVPAIYAASGAIAGEDWTRANRTSENTAYGLGKRALSLLMDQSTGLGDGTATITRTCTSFQLLARAHASSNTSLFVSIDGAADVVWDIVGASGEVRWASPALTAGSHTVRVKARSNSAAYFEGGMFFNGDENSGIRLWEGARSGSRADQFNAETTNGAFWADTLAQITPDLLIIEWITNDATVRTSAQYDTSMRAVIDLARTKAANAPILLLAMYERGDTALVEPWANYVNVMRGISSDYPNVAFLDLGDHIPKLYGADTYSLLTDAVHPSDKGHALIGNLVAGYLLPR